MLFLLNNSNCDSAFTHRSAQEEAYGQPTAERAPARIRLADLQSIIITYVCLPSNYGVNFLHIYLI